MDDERPETTATLDVTEDLENTSNNHPIQNRYTFWFRGGTAAASKVTGAAYTESIRQIDSFQTVGRILYLPRKVEPVTHSI